jgi:hypothetical protein
MHRAGSALGSRCTHGGSSVVGSDGEEAVRNGNCGAEYKMPQSTK